MLFVRLNEPLWCLVLVGWVLTRWAGERLAAGPAETVARAERDSDATAGSTQRALPDPEQASARELRQLPGIGETRALEIVRDRWERRASDAPLEWSKIRGVGPLTEKRIREALGEPPDNSAARRAGP